MQYMRGLGNRFCKGERKGDKAEKKKAAQNESTADQDVQQKDLLRMGWEQVLGKQCRELTQREERMMGPDGLSEDDQDQLHQELEKLWLQIRLEVLKTFSPDFRAERLRAAVLCILQQEEIDQRWLSLDSDQIPLWRPNQSLLGHNELLGCMIKSRLSQHPPKDAAEDQIGAKVQNGAEDQSGAEDQDAEAQSEPVTEEICRMGLQMKQDLLFILKTVAPCYSPEIDILNIYVGLYHRFFSSRLEQLTTSPLDNSDLYCLLEWVNHRYPRDILLDPELEGKVDAQSLGPLLPTDVLQTLQDQYLKNTESTLQEWLDRALKIESESWVKGCNLDLFPSYCYSPLASDAIQVIDSALKRVRCVSSEQSSERITDHLDSFFSRYLQAVEEFVKSNQRNVASVLKAQLACEEQFRELVLNQEMAEQRRKCCLDLLDALKDCGYCSLTSTICSQLKERLSGLWTPKWLDGSLPVIDSLLDVLDQQLEHLSDLKPSCREWLLGLLHRDVALRYIKNLLKTGSKSQKKQVGGANRMKDDVNKMDSFFTQQGSSGSEWVTKILLHVVEVLGLQDPDSVQLELVSLVHFCPDLSAAHISRLLLLKGGLSVASIRKIKRSVEVNRPQEDPSPNHSPLFFSKLKGKWIKDKMNQLKLT